jgi:PAS domain S-box-containing protein
MIFADQTTRSVRSAELLAAARPHLRWLSAAFSGMRHALYLTDRQGGVLHSEGDEALPANCLWAGAPIRDPEGEIIGAIDLATAVAHNGPSHLPLMTYAALMIERELDHESRQAESRRLEQLAESLAASEAALHESEEHLRRVLNNLFAFVGVLAPDGTLLEANRAPLEAAGISACEVIGKKFWDCHWWSFSPPSQARLRQSVERAARGETLRYDVQVRMAHESPIWIDFQLAPMRDEAGRITHLIPSGMDISERKRSEAALRASEEKLRDADRRKDRFLAMLAHELRNPLAPIRNAVEILRRHGSARPSFVEARAVIDRQLHHMVRLIDDLLDVSRITLGKLELRRERVALASIVEQALETSRPHLEHELSVCLPRQALYVVADPIRLAQVLSNLLNNACKYTEKGGRIELKVERDGGQAVVRLKDSGIGIPREQLPRLFEMFSQLDSAMERSRGGLGIGLALGRALVEMQGGTLLAHSEGPGKGSEFIVRLPALDETSLPQPSRTEPRGRGTPAPGRRLLVVDDNRDAASSLALLLRMGGNEVDTAHDGVEALEKTPAYEPEAVLLDIGMPKMNGYDTCRALRELPGGESIAIIALTGWGQEGDLRRSREAGFDAHLVKPVDPGVLMEVLGSALARRQANSND